MGDPAIPSVISMYGQMHCRTREVMPSDDHQRATTRVSPTLAGYVASPLPTPASGIGPRHAPPLVVANRSGARKTSLQSPGRPQDELMAPHLSAHPGASAADVSDDPGGTRPRRRNPTPSIAGVDVRWTIPPPVVPDWPVSPGVTARVLGGTSYGARKSRPLPGIGRVADRHPGGDHARLPQPGYAP